MSCHFNITKIANANNIIYLNVGGKHFDTFYGTLATGESLFFHQIFRKSQGKKNIVLVNGKKIILDNEGRLFIDRNGGVFKYILDYLRTGRTNILPESYEELKELYREAIFFQIHELAYYVSSVIKNYPKYEPYDFASYPSLQYSCINCHNNKKMDNHKNGLENERYDQKDTIKIKSSY